MRTQRPNRQQVMDFVRRALPYLLIAALTWIAHFWHFRQFGLYEDDYRFIATYFDTPLSSIIPISIDALTHWPQGRPLQSIMPPLITMLLFPLGGLPLLYLATYVIVVISAVFFYWLAKHASGSEGFAAIGVIAFILFPADTTHPLMVHAFCYRIGLICGIWASLLYLKDRRLAAYGVAFISLMLYETPFLIFISSPLLKLQWESRQGWREYLRHGVLCAALIAITVAIRILNDESRVVAATGDIRAIILLLPENLLFGPVWVIRQMLWGPITRILTWSVGSFMLIAATAPLFYAVLRWAFQREPHSDRQPLADLPAIATSEPYSIAPLLRLIAASAAMMVMAYLLSFTHYVDFVYGRLTSVHMAATVGASLLFAAVIYGLLLYLRLPMLRHVALVFLALWFGLLMGYRYSIQEDFALSWSIQRWYWTDVSAASHNLDDGTVILVEGDLPRTLFILMNSWADELVLPRMYRFPSEWAREPIVLPMLMTKLSQENDALLAYFDNRPVGIELEQGNVILLHYDGERLVRVDGPTATVDGVTLHLRQPTTDASDYPTRPLYDLLIDPTLLD